MVRKYNRYNIEELRKIVSESVSYAEVCRKFNKSPVGGNCTNISLLCKRYNIDTNHMTGKAHNKGRISRNRKTIDEFLVMGSPTDHRIAAPRLHKRLVELGVEYKCNSCGIFDWNGEQIILEIDHIDEQYWNNTKENLQLLCPNCHAQKTKKHANMRHTV